ncbi:hypothetical protein [Neobacillus jeddahensis]|uniref:hypothetical protein n=1 Tax=Neobacillus jeddahensis TaxID=1461580 RepID=UPI000694B96D|nr:hypothetical protein [Neobacillus jeddahensis]
MNQHLITIILIGALIVFSIYRRISRMIGWQPLKRGRIQFKLVLFFIIGLMLLTVSLSHPISLVSDIVGIILGSILAYYGAGLTTFEQRNGKIHYRPNMWIGGIVTVLFLVRFTYRIYGMFTTGIFTGTQQGQANSWQSLSTSVGSSWTAGLMLIMFAYYICYYMILLKKQKQLSHPENNNTVL